MNLTNARDHLDLAQKQWDSAATDSWEPEEPASCVTSVFYAYENVVVALAEVFDIKWKKNHYDKADIAAQLAKDGKLSKDISQLMLRLNGLRKDVSYGEPGADLLNEDLETLVSDLESTIDEANEIVSGLEEAAAEGEDE
jgi:hypothetical protein